MALFKLAHLYPELMNLYGDRGNLICLKKRLEWRGHHCEIAPISRGEEISYQDYDLLLMGGGSDREQGLMYEDLINMADGLWDKIEQGYPILCICGAYQLLGSYYRSLDGQMLRGLGLFDFYTQSEKGRLIGNILLEIELYGQKGTVVGFENHGGRTYIEDKRLKPLGKVLKGFGNNGKDGCEGIWYKNLIGTYLHGPLLPKNPALADYFIRAMASRRGLVIEEVLNDEVENFAHQEVKAMLSK